MRISDWSSDVCSSDLPAYGRDFRHVGQCLELIAQEPILQRAQLREVMFARSVYQSILVDPADTCGVRAQSGFGGGGKPTLHLTQVLQHPRTGPIEVGAVLDRKSTRLNSSP